MSKGNKGTKKRNTETKRKTNKPPGETTDDYIINLSEEGKDYSTDAPADDYRIVLSDDSDFILDWYAESSSSTDSVN